MSSFVVERQHSELVKEVWEFWLTVENRPTDGIYLDWYGKLERQSKRHKWVEHATYSRMTHSRKGTIKDEADVPLPQSVITQAEKMIRNSLCFKAWKDR